MNDIQAIKDSVDLRAVVAQSLTPLHQGGHVWEFACPFHNERTTGAFKVWPNGYHCFSCGAQGDYPDWVSFITGKPLAEVLKGLGVDFVSTRKVVVDHNQERMQQAMAAQAALQAARRWEQYHDGLTDWARRLWEQRGVPAWYQDYAMFGFSPDFTVMHNGALYHTPTLTIPVFEPVSRTCLTIRHRLLNPPDTNAGSKYRPERSGLGSHLFVADPDKPIAGKVLVAEGEIKAAVAFAALDDPNWQVVGLPGKTPKPALLQQLAQAEQIVLCLDPDAAEQVPAIGNALGADRVRVLALDEKIDDMIVSYGLGKPWLTARIRQARRLDNGQK